MDTKKSKLTAIRIWLSIVKNRSEFSLISWPNKEKLSAHNSVADDAASRLVKRGLRLRMA